MTAAARDRRWVKRGAYILGALGAVSLSVAVTAQVAGEMDIFQDPPANDPSALVEPAIGPVANDALKLLEHTNHAAYEGGATDSKIDTTTDTSIPLSQQTSNQIPTGGRPSPDFGAVRYTTPLLMFEEFGPEKLDSGVTPGTNPLPVPKIGPAPEQDPNKVARSAPNGKELEAFLAQQSLYPFPTHESNTLDANPWRSVVGEFLQRDITSPAEGRPPGEGWAHQRWNEFYPQAYFKTAQAGARVNNGFRDSKQLHGYTKGEFGPGGLYHKTFLDNPAAGDNKNGTTKGIGVRFHQNFPVQNHNSVWTFDGTMPPKLLMARYGQPIMMRHYNALPIDPSANKGFGLHTITTHEHNGHNPAESDGMAQAFFFPGQFYDYRWPIQLAGYDSINTGAKDPRAGFPCSPGETLFVNDSAPGKKSCPANGLIPIRGDWRETMSTHWFHDHMLDFTAQNVYKGNAVMMNYYSAIDRGNESVDCHYKETTAKNLADAKTNVNLCFPSGSAMPWGNRDYDINLVVADKAWDKDGQLWFNVFNKNGFLGDRILTNFVYHPYLDVRARRYRFRFLDGAVSRYLSIALVQEVRGTAGEIKGASGTGVSYNRVPFHMIANDGNILEHAVPFDGTVDLDGNGNKDEHKGQLPQQSIAERYDIVVDFAKYGIKPGDKLYFVNVQEHTAPQVTNRRIPIADVLNGTYKPGVATDTDGDGVADKWVGGDPGVGKFMELRIQSCKNASGVVIACPDTSMNPADYVAGKKKMVPLKIDRDSATQYAAKLQNANHRDYTFGHSGGTDDQPWTIKTDGGVGYNADMRRVSAAPRLATGPTLGGSVQNDTPYEVWKLNLGGGWDHPVHIHFEEGVILRRDGKTPPEWEKWARKDVYRIGPDKHAGASVEIAFQFREFAGSFVEHCHATQHEDNAMLLRWDLQRPGQTMAMPTPMPTWDGVHYTGTAALATYETGLGTGTSYIFGK